MRANAPASGRAPAPFIHIARRQAAKEASLEKALAKMKADWAGAELRVVAYKDTGTYVIGGTDDVQARAGGAGLRAGGVAGFSRRGRKTAENQKLRARAAPTQQPAYTARPG